MSELNDDPGWRRSTRHALLGLIPGLRTLQLRRTREGEGLVVLRGVFLSFLLALAMLGVVVVVLDINTSGFGTLSELPVALVVLSVGVASVVASALVGPDLQCQDDVQMAKRYVQRFFLRLALAETAALVGFVGFMLSGAGWIYFLATAFSAVGFSRLAPTEGHLRKDQDGLSAMGCQRSLLVALQQYGLRRG